MIEHLRPNHVTITTLTNYLQELKTVLMPIGDSKGRRNLFTTCKQAVTEDPNRLYSETCLEEHPRDSDGSTTRD